MNSNTSALSLDTQIQQLDFQRQQFEFIQRQAKMLANSDFVPDKFKGNTSNCSLVIEMANRLGIDAFLISRQIFFVHGTPAFSSKFLIALLNQSHLLRGRLQFKKIGKEKTDNFGMLAWGIDAQSGEKIEGPEITIQMAKDEGWYSKTGSKWKTIPELMLMYRSASWFINTYYPEIASGMTSVDEIRDGAATKPEIYEHEIDAEIIKKDHARTKPEKEKENENETIDYETGEIKHNHVDVNPESPAFSAFKKKLDNCKTQDELKELNTSSLMRKMMKSENERIQEMVIEKAKALKQGASNNDG